MRRSPSGAIPLTQACNPGRKRVWTFLLASLFLMLLLSFQLADDQDVVDLSHYSFIFDKNSTEDEICKIPVLDPWDASVRKYIQNAPPVECSEIQPKLIFLSNQQVLFNKTAFDQAGYSTDSVKCQLRCFDRGEDDNTNFYEEWTTFQNGTAIGCEFVEVDCRRKITSLSVYNEFHAQIVPKERTLAKSNKFSVSLFVLDSVSQQHWRRGLTRTLDVLQRIYNSTIMTGFNKVADNSFPNAIAFLVGQEPEIELPRETGKLADFNTWPIIWKNFHKQGYVTMYAEDYPEFNLFNYLKPGFSAKPVDHYFRPYWLEVYRSFLRRRSKYLCYNHRPMHIVQMDYYRKLLQVYHKKRSFFVLHWLTELAHDWLSQVSSADGDIERMLIEEEPRLRDTFLFMFSDHGHRFDPIRQTMIGRLEERMPFFSFHVPRQLTEQFPELVEVLEWNSKQLSSFFDLHITMRDILDLQERNAWHELKEKNQPLERFKKLSVYGLSLLRPLPENRSCEEAGIPEYYCICQTETVVDANEPIVHRVAEHLVEHTNQLLEPVGNICATLKLKRVTEARTSAPNQKIVSGYGPTRSHLFSVREYNSGVSRGVYLNYALMIEVEPSKAVLEATVRHYFADDSIKVVSDVSRLNKYGNQSICVQDAILRKYCYCI